MIVRSTKQAKGDVNWWSAPPRNHWKTGQNFHYHIIILIGLDFGHSLRSPREETARERSEGLFPDQQLIIEPNILFYFFNFKEKLHTISNKEQISDFGFVDSILRLISIT